MKSLPLIIDADPGIDDAVALMIALKSPALDIKLITCTAGNTTIENVTNNTLSVLDFLHAGDIPVAAGAKKPIKRKSFNFLGVHGADGMGGFKFPETTRKISELSAVEHMHKVLNESKTKVTILTIGPLTNIAMLLTAYPEDEEKIEKLVFMGGSFLETGKSTPYPEFNIASDPEATELVFASNIKKIMIPMEMGHTAFLNGKDVKRTGQNNKIGEFFTYMFRSYRTIGEVFKTFISNIDKNREDNVVGDAFEFIFKSYHDRHVKDGIPMHDGVAVAYLIDPKMFKLLPAKAEVKYFEEVKSGVSICDFKAEPNMMVATEINVRKFKRLYFRALEMSNLERRVVEKNWRPVSGIAKV